MYTNSASDSIEGRLGPVEEDEAEIGKVFEILWRIGLFIEAANFSLPIKCSHGLAGDNNMPLTQ